MSTIEEIVSNLRNDAVDSKPLTIDWAETLGEDMEGWRSYEAIECEECGTVHVLSMTGETRCCDELPEREIEVLPTNGVEFKCLDCGDVFTVKIDSESNSFDSFECPHCSEGYYEGSEHSNQCDGYLYAEGPMMNYFYPVDLSDPEETARELGSGCVCVVELRDGTTGLALTGGGMDLSWEICQAFIDAGYLPPAHFAGSLPRMAQWETAERTALILAAAECSCQCAVNWAQNGLDHVLRLKKEAAKSAA